MRLVTFSSLGITSIGIELESGILNIPEAASRFGRRYQIDGQPFPNTMMRLLEWEPGFEVARQILDRFVKTPENERPLVLSAGDITIEAPIRKPGKIIAIGLNYTDHIEETGKDVPEYPVVFAKFPSSIVGPDDPISHPTLTKRLDWEVELGVVMGRRCKDVGENEVLNFVAGYTVVNDLSARDLQLQDGQWVRGKSLDGLCPMGPCIVTTDDLGDASGLKMHTKVNGEIKQDSNTSNLLFGVPQLVSYLSQSFTLEPGDVIATGTPSGVGFARDPPEFLKAGDEVEVYIEKIGSLRNKIV
ncbi:MAG: fumarylacetoacetate hydrolase family protein [Candidatus Thorarchaeota archaeon]|jgi:acylpyruvate hydrolase